MHHVLSYTDSCMYWCLAYIWGYFRPTHICRSNVFISIGSGRYNMLWYFVGLLTLYLLRVYMLHHWRLIKHDISAQDKHFALWIPKFVVFYVFLESYVYSFPCSQTQLVFFNMIIGQTIKYRVIILNNFFRPNFQRSLTSYHKRRNLLTRWQAYANASVQKDFDILVLDNMQHTFSRKILFILSVTYFVAVFLLPWSAFLCRHRDIVVLKGRWGTLHHYLNGVL